MSKGSVKKILGRLLTFLSKNNLKQLLTLLSKSRQFWKCTVLSHLKQYLILLSKNRQCIKYTAHIVVSSVTSHTTYFGIKEPTLFTVLSAHRLDSATFQIIVHSYLVIKESTLLKVHSARRLSSVSSHTTAYSAIKEPILPVFYVLSHLKCLLCH